MSGQLQVQLTETAEAAYAGYYRDAEGCILEGDESSPKVKALRDLEEALTTTIPANPFNQKIALAGYLSTIFRFSKERLRICYLCHGLQRRIVILYICEAGAEEAECYATFTYMVMSGEFDAAFVSLGLTPPSRSGLTQRPSIN
ncbi:MAG TPA: hypothetical protein VJN42_09130 [Candidatus Acidoferrum sp.]|nr:hypothetical protein [Candidatus Acidoferrum sp.]